MARKTEIHTLGRGNMARKTEKGGKYRNVQCGTWNIARKLKIAENEKYTI
jgi:hypothetical protein